MTREEAIGHIKDVICENNTIKPNMVVFEQEKEALCMAIKALEQEPCEAVSRADTLQSFESYCENNCQYSKKQRNVMCGACMMGDAIEIVENLPPVTPKPLDAVLDEIMAEINELYSYVEFDEDIKTSFNMVRLEEVQRVIDKYKAESEGKE